MSAVPAPTEQWRAGLLAGREALRQVTSNPGSDESPAWSPDGRSIAYVTTIEPTIIWYATRHLAVVPVAGGAPRLFTRALDRNVSAPVFSADGRAILFSLEDSAEDHLARVDVASGRITRPVSGPLRVSAFMQARDERVVTLIE